jgi:hypothetical protein
MTPAMIAALFPPKPKPEEAWRNDYQDEPADLPPPAQPDAQPQAPRVSLVDILREHHAEEQRAATALNAIRLGRTPPPGGLFGIGAGSDPQNGGVPGFNAGRFGVGTDTLPMQPSSFAPQQPFDIDFTRSRDQSSVERQWLTPPSFPNVAPPERRFPTQIPQFDLSSSQHDQSRVAPFGQTPATGPRIAGSSETLAPKLDAGATPNMTHNITRRQSQSGNTATKNVLPALPKFGAGPTFGFNRIPAWLMTYPDYNDLQLVVDRQNRALQAPDGAIYIAPPGVTNEYLLGALNHLSDVAKSGGPFAVEREFRSMYTDPHNPHFIDFKVFDTPNGPDWARRVTPVARVTYRSSATGRFVTASPYEAFGNFFYGFAGRWANISPEELRAVAGLVQQGRSTVDKVVHGLPDNSEDVPHVSAGMSVHESYRATPQPMFGVSPMPPRPTGPELKRFNR